METTVFEGREGGDGRIQGGAAGLRLAAFAVREEHMGRAGEWPWRAGTAALFDTMWNKGTRGGQGGSGLRDAPDHPDLRRCRSELGCIGCVGAAGCGGAGGAVLTAVGPDVDTSGPGGGG